MYLGSARRRVVSHGAKVCENKCYDDDERAEGKAGVKAFD